MDTSNSEQSASSWSPPPTLSVGIVDARPETGRGAARLVSLGRVSLVLGVLVVGFLVASPFASGPTESAEPAVPGAQSGLIAVPSSAGQSPETSPSTLRMDNQDQGPDADKNPAAARLVKSVEQDPAPSGDGKNAETSKATSAKTVTSMPAPRSMAAWWKYLQKKLAGACDHKVSVETRARVLHTIEAGRVRTVDVEDTGNTPLNTCVSSVLGNQIREGWPTSTASSGAPQMYEYVVNPRRG